MEAIGIAMIAILAYLITIYDQGVAGAIPVLGALNAKYYPKADATKNADNAGSADANAAIGSGSSISLKMNILLNFFFFKSLIKLIAPKKPSCFPFEDAFLSKI